MDRHEFINLCAIDCLKSFIDKLPMVGLPETPMDPQARYNLIQKLTKDSFDLAVAMADYRRTIV